jgi:hypothetical protein
MPRPAPSRRVVSFARRRWLLPLLAGTTTLSLLAAPLPQAWAQPAAAPKAAASSDDASLSEADARVAAERILTTLQKRDAKARFALFAPRLQRVSSPALVESHIKRQPPILRWQITSVLPGVSGATVEALLVTAKGSRQLLLQLDGQGRLAGYHINAADQPAEKVVREFMEAVLSGRYVLASSFLSPDFQKEVPPAALQRKWQNLQLITGNFVRIRRILPSESTVDMKLVLVNTEFTRLTDSLYVILDAGNSIIGVDFPAEPATPGQPR